MPQKASSPHPSHKWDDGSLIGVKCCKMCGFALGGARSEQPCRRVGMRPWDYHAERAKETRRLGRRRRKGTGLVDDP